MNEVFDGNEDRLEADALAAHGVFVCNARGTLAKADRGGRGGLGVIIAGHGEEGSALGSVPA